MEKTNVRRTAIGLAVQAAKLLDISYKYLKYTTLNEYFEILPEAHLSETTVPSLKYFAIGRGGHRMILDNEDVAVPDVVEHETTNTGPYKPVPFVLRQLNDDLSLEDRKRYALRRKEQHNGVEYWAYYLKRLDLPTTPPQVLWDNTVDGVTTTRLFNYSDQDLRPTPHELPATGVTVSSADIIRISSRISIILDERDIKEYYNVCEVLYGSSKYAIISEIMLCTGLDQEVNVPSGTGTNVLMKEVIGAQVAAYISTYISAKSMNGSIVYECDLGSGEPLLTNGESISSRYSIDTLPSVSSKTLEGTVYDATNKPAATTTDIAAASSATS